MLRRDRQLRTQIYQVKDAALFAVGLWVAYFWRDHFPEEWLFWKFEAIDPFMRFAWIYIVIIPLILKTLIRNHSIDFERIASESFLRF